MGSEWTNGRLADLVEVSMGQSPSGDKCSSTPSGVPLLNGPTEFGYHHPAPVQFTTDPKKFAQKGDLLFCVRGSTTGRMNWADQRYAIGRGVASLRHRHGLQFQPFAHAVIENRLPTLLASATGSTFPNVSRSQLLELEVEIPPLPEQKAIAHVLGSLDDKIELNQQMNATLEAMAQALFKSWFVDFDPVIDNALAAGKPIPGELQARAAARESLGDARKPLPEHLQNRFPASFTHTEELGWIPEGWAVKAIGDVTECVGGGTPSTKEPKFWEGGSHYWTTPKDFSSLQSPFLTDTERRITEAGVKKISSGLLPVGTLLMSSRAPVGYLAISTMPVAINQGFIAMICDYSLSNYFILSWCRVNMEKIKSRAGGTTFAEISKKAFRPIPILVPTTDLVVAFTEAVSPYYEKVVANLLHSRDLAKTRDTLLPKLLSGELRLPIDELEVAV